MANSYFVCGARQYVLASTDDSAVVRFFVFFVDGVRSVVSYIAKRRVRSVVRSCAITRS